MARTLHLSGRLSPTKINARCVCQRYALFTANAEPINGEVVADSVDSPGKARRVTTSSMFFPSKHIVGHTSENKHQGQDLMLRLGLMRQACSGFYHLLPMGYRVLEKLAALVDRHLQAIGAVKMAMPMMTPSNLWKRSGRWEQTGSELFHIYDRCRKQYCLGPTHEESMTSLVKDMLTSRRQLPLRLYQLDRKFRDELRPRFGLIRAREFWMKDLYTFDETEEEAQDTYEEVTDCYRRILEELSVPFVKAEADTGDIGGSHSHEYLIPSAAGEAVITHCSECDIHSSKVLLLRQKSLTNCPNSGKGLCSLRETRGVEVAHTFYLGTRYSDIFDLHYKDHRDQKCLVQMGCYGIGVSRLLATLVEHGCSQQPNRLVWPPAVAPYSICVVALVNTVNDPLHKQALELYDAAQEAFPGDVILDDRVHLTIGERLNDLQSYGYPLSIVVGNKSPKGTIEIETAQGKRLHIETGDFINIICSLLRSK